MHHKWTGYIQSMIFKILPYQLQTKVQPTENYCYSSIHHLSECKELKINKKAPSELIVIGLMSITR